MFLIVIHKISIQIKKVLRIKDKFRNKAIILIIKEMLQIMKINKAFWMKWNLKELEQQA